MILQIRLYNDPVLRKKAHPVDKVTREVRQLAEDMIETCRANDGIGLAAPQVGVSLRLIVLLLSDETNPEQLLPGHPLVLINPKLSSPREETWFRQEGCLSIPRIYGEVERPIGIHLEAMDLDGREISRDFIGMEARLLMHENDHLNGVLFIDRLDRRVRRDLEHVLRDLERSTKKK